MTKKCFKIVVLLIIFAILSSSTAIIVSNAEQTYRDIKENLPQEELTLSNEKSIEEDLISGRDKGKYTVYHNQSADGYHILKDGENPEHIDKVKVKEWYDEIIANNFYDNWQFGIDKNGNIGWRIYPEGTWSPGSPEDSSYEAWKKLAKYAKYWLTSNYTSIEPTGTINWTSEENHQEMRAKNLKWVYGYNAKTLIKTWYDRISTDYGELTITELIDALNDPDFEKNSEDDDKRSGWYFLATNFSVFCLKNWQKLGSTHGVNLERFSKPDIDVSTIAKVDYNNDTVSINMSDTSDFYDDDFKKEKDTVGTKKQLRTNVKYFHDDIQNLYSINNSFDTYTTNVFAYATAYAEKYEDAYHTIGGGYANERAQQAIWGVVGDGDITIYDLFNCGKALDEYESILTSGTDLAHHLNAVNGTSLLDNPQVSIVNNEDSDKFALKSKIGSVEDSTGTTLQKGSDGNLYYKIGPFNMSNYALAFAKDEVPIKNFSGSDCSKYKQMLGGIEKGVVRFNNGTELEIGDKIKVEYTDMNGNSTSTGSNRSGTYTYTPTSSNYDYPFPNSVFYLKVKKSDVGNATTLNKITFNYRQTCADANGWVITSKYVDSEFEYKDNSTGCLAYHCLGGVCNGRTCPRNHRQGEVIVNGGKVRCNGHNYTNCHASYWDLLSAKVVDGQPLLAVHDSVVEVGYTERVSTLNVRLTTNVSIDKYIIDTYPNMPDEIANGTDHTNKRKNWFKCFFVENRRRN